MSYDFTEIISSVKTRVDQCNAIREVGELEKSLYKTGDAGFDTQLETSVSKDMAQIIHAIITENSIESDTDSKVTLLRELKKCLSDMPVVRIDVPIELSEAMIKKLHRWITDKCGPGRVLDIEMDESIIGGARITHNGRYADGSLNQIWTDTWKDIKI
jgi:F0F1-type ATP synthase delta subunit